MKYIYLVFVIAFTVSSCGSSKRSVANTPEDKALISAIKKLDKKPNDESLQSNLNGLYKNAAQTHLDNIDVYETLTEPEKWDKILKEYNALQKLNEVINSSPEASKLVNPQSYAAKTDLVREKAAEEYYSLGLQYMEGETIESARKAYYAFQKANSYSPGYKEVRDMLAITQEKSILNVVINPVTDDSYYYNNMGQNRYGNSFNNDYLQRNLVRDLGGNNNNSLTHFYTPQDADRVNETMDWVIDLTWVNLDVPQPYSSQRSQNVSKQIEIGRDTANKPVYQTVTATVYITRKQFRARGDLEARITDISTRNNVDLNRYSSSVDWDQEYATYRGDSRALSDYYLNLVHSNNSRMPSKEEILDELYEKIYSQVKSGIHRAVKM